MSENNIKPEIEAEIIHKKSNGEITIHKLNSEEIIKSEK